MEIRPLEKDTYQGRKFTARYQTRGYYDIRPTATGFEMPYVPLKTPVEKSFDDEFFGEWLDEPVAYGAFEGEKLLGYVEGAPENWNRRFRISNLCVFDGSARRRGIGSALMQTILAEAVQAGARMAVLETQSCNENAIAFYRKNGFEIIGFDLYAYSNTDPERHEVRLEMGKKLEENLRKK